jgi:hypothetical protein
LYRKLNQGAPIGTFGIGTVDFLIVGLYTLFATVRARRDIPGGSRSLRCSA